MVKLETQRQLPENHSIEVNTVDQYQGRDKEVSFFFKRNLHKNKNMVFY